MSSNMSGAGLHPPIRIASVSQGCPEPLPGPSGLSAVCSNASVQEQSFLEALDVFDPRIKHDLLNFACGSHSVFFIKSCGTELLELR